MRQRSTRTRLVLALAGTLLGLLLLGGGAAYAKYPAPLGARESSPAAPAQNAAPLGATPTPSTGCLTFSGSLDTTDPTFTRPSTFTQGNTCTTGTAGVHYDVYEVNSATAASITASFCAADGGSAGFDTFLAIYQDPTGARQVGFVPNACNLALAANDDFCGVQSRVSANVVAGYFYVVVTQFSTGTGAYTLAVNGLSGCLATATSTPTSTPTQTPTATPPVCGAYNVSTTAGSVISGTLDIGNHCDDCYTSITLPFPVTLYDQTFTTANISSNGIAVFGTGTPSFTNSCLPASSTTYAIFPYWDDLRTDGAGGAAGIFTTTTGIAGTRNFYVEWRSCIRTSSSTCSAVDTNFELVFHENQPGVFNVVYGAMLQNGSGATTGVQQSTTNWTQFSCNTAALSSGLQVNYTSQPSCGSPTPTPSATRTNTATNTPTNTPTITPGGPTNTATVTSTATATPPVCGGYTIAAAAGTIVAGTTDTGNHTDDGTTTITLPFPVTLYDQTYTTAQVGSNGTLSFGTANNAFTNSCLPASSSTYEIFPYWDDQCTGPCGFTFTPNKGKAASGPNSTPCTGCGIYTTQVGNTFYIEWRTNLYNATTPVNYEVVLTQGSPNFSVVYGSTPGGGGATSGVQQSTTNWTQWSCNTATLPTGLQLNYTLGPSCGTATPTPTFPTSTPTATATATATPPVCDGYTIAAAAGTIVAGTTDTGNHCDDCTTTITLPFPVTLYDQTYTTAQVGSNGTLSFGTANNGITNSCLPATSATYEIFAYWDDQCTASCGFTFTPNKGTAGRSGPNSTPCTGCGIYTTQVGSTFYIEWRTNLYNTTTPVNYEVVLTSGSPNFSVIYNQVATNGSDATTGVQQSTTNWTQWSCNTATVSPGMQLNYTLQPSCFSPTPTATPVCTPVLNGHLTYQGMPQPNAGNVQNFTLQLQPSPSGPVSTFTGSADANGNFTVPLGSLVPGVYNWWFKSTRYLARGGTLTIVSGCSTSFDFGQQRAGDINNDNCVDVTDFSQLRATFGKACGDIGYNANADYNNDCLVDTTDFSLLRSNFGTCGATALSLSGSRP